MVTVLTLVHWTAFDYSILHGVNGVSRRSVLLDHAINASTRLMFSNLLLVSLLWYVWFENEDGRRRAGIILGVVVTFAGGICSRFLQHLLHSHPRPLNDPDLHFLLPYAVNPTALNRWFSFPSDHAVIWFGLAATLSLANRRIGRIAYALAIVFAVLRTYQGIHFPTDVIAGAMMGILFVELTRSVVDASAAQPLVRLTERPQPMFYAAAFFLCFGFTQLFTDVREPAAGLLRLLRDPQHTSEGAMGSATAAPGSIRVADALPLTSATPVH